MTRVAKMRNLLCAAGRERNFGGIDVVKAESEVTTNFLISSLFVLTIQYYILCI